MLALAASLVFNVLAWQIGSGRCCRVYSAVSVYDGSPVALKFYRRGAEFEGAAQRERFVLSSFNQPNLVSSLAWLEYRGLHCLVLELLDHNIRQVSSAPHWLAWCKNCSLSITPQHSRPNPLRFNTFLKVVCSNFL